MLNEDDFLGWCTRLALTGRARATVAEARAHNPIRRVGGGRQNVSGRYPSRKMGVTIQFESHRVELAFVYEMEHDPAVLEYYDQPPSIPLAYEAANGRRLSVLQGKQRNRGWLNVSCQRLPEDHTIPRIPPPSHAGAVHQHLHSCADSPFRELRALADGELFDSDQTEARWYHPTV